MKDVKLVKLVGDIRSVNIDEIRKLEVGVEIQNFSTKYIRWRL
ncbi:hypothetical protein [Paraclostridium sordellii]|nr:hypothetical protein [Paeniclostridium sordellii]